MSKQSTKSSSRAASGGSSGNGGRMTETTGTQDERSGMMAGASDLAHEAADKVRHAASSGASTVKRQVTDALDRQVSSGADVISHVASSTRRAADELERDVPQLAGMIRSMADSVDIYADDLKTKSIEDIVRSASDLARRQPAAVFGFAAMAGFLVFRMLKAASEGQSASDGLSGMSDYRSGDAGYGAAGKRMGGSGDYVS